MRRLPALLSMMAFSTLSGAATLESILEPFTIPAAADYTANEWPVLNKMREVKWRKKEGPSGANWGETTLARLGPAMVSASGPRTMVFGLSVMISEGKGKIFEQEQFDSVLAAQFSPETTLRKIRGVCPESAGGISGDAVYEVTLKNRKPIYAYVATDSGGNAPNSRSSSFDFSVQNEARWKCAGPAPMPQRVVAPPPPAPTAAVTPGRRLFGTWNATHCEYYLNGQLAPLQNCKLNAGISLEFSPARLVFTLPGREPDVTINPRYQDTPNWVDVTDLKGGVNRMVLTAPDKAYMATAKKDERQTKIYFSRVAVLSE